MIIGTLRRIPERSLQPSPAGPPLAPGRASPPRDPRASRRRLQASGAVAFISLAGLGLILLLLSAGAPMLTVAVPAAALGTMFCLARPAATVVFVVFLSGFIGTLIAHTGMPAESLAQSLLVCLWLAVIVMYATGRANGKVWFWPGLALPALYLIVTVIGLAAAENVGAAFTGFRLAGWYMAAFLLIALAPLSPATLQRIVRGIACVAVAVGTYAVYRKIVGPSADEMALARVSTGVRASEEIRFFGSFMGPQQLAAWGAAAIPFSLALALGWNGRWRAVAIAAVGFCTFAVLASDIRTGMVGAVAGVAFVLLLYQLSHAFRGPRLAVGLAAVLCLVGVAAVGYATTLADSDSSSARLEKLLTPGDDYPYQQRTARWEEAIKDMNRKPFGHGLGTAGYAGITENYSNFAGPYNLDSSYLKIGLEQGYPVLILFVGALLALLGGIARRAAGARERWRATLGIGASGTLVAEIVLFYGSTYIEGIPVLFAWTLIGLGAAPFTFIWAPDGEQEESAEPRAKPVGPAQQAAPVPA